MAYLSWTLPLKQKIADILPAAPEPIIWSRTKILSTHKLYLVIEMNANETEIPDYTNTSHVKNA